MTDRPDDTLMGLWAEDLEDLDREIARMAMLCRVKVLDPAVVHRVLQNDASVCGVSNPVAFKKLHDLLMVHFALQTRANEQLGEARTAAIVACVVERLSKSFPGELGSPP